MLLTSDSTPRPTFLLDMQAYYAYSACMKTIQYTIRGVPERVDALLRTQARKEHKSLNTVAVEILARGIGIGDEEPEFHDMDDLVGTWVEDPEFDAAVKVMDSIDEELWK